jgi:hypothetical protein
MSRCATQTAKQTAEKYIEAGYTTLVVTNHFKASNMRSDDWREAVDLFFEAIDLVREAAGERLNVLDGAEVELNTGNNEYLLYGASRERFYEIPDLLDLSFAQLFEQSKKQGMLMVQAHPFRFNMEVVTPGYLRGIEVFNGEAGEDSHNWAAMAWLKHFQDKNDLFPTSGSDCHWVDQMPNGGILTERPIRSNDELLSVLLGREYALISDCFDARDAMDGVRIEDPFA